ncbi:MAG TPA: YbaY family lipoprotein [Solirubrobacterales bacterium]|nr:YbaY family lipoprotein [Solirubrobacterales bacterium]
MGQVRFRLEVPASAPAGQESTVRVAVRDTSEADALHPAVAEAVSRMAVDTDGVELSLDLPETLDPRHRYSVWAHVDRDGSGEIAAGDLITTRDVALDPQRLGPGPIDVPLTQI